MLFKTYLLTVCPSVSEMVQGGQQELHAHWLLPPQRHSSDQTGKDKQSCDQQRESLTFSHKQPPFVIGCEKKWPNCLVHLQYKYKEAYEMMKAKAYTLHPEGVSFVNTRKVNKIINDVRGRHKTSHISIIAAWETTWPYLCSSSVCIVRLTRSRRTRSTWPTTLLISIKSRWTNETSVMYGTACWKPILLCIWLSTLCQYVFFSLLFLAPLQREVLQQQRPADLHAHDTWTHTLLPRQWDHKRRMLRTFTLILAESC